MVPILDISGGTFWTLYAIGMVKSGIARGIALAPGNENGVAKVPYSGVELQELEFIIRRYCLLWSVEI
jgi:hypothetical protein